MKTVVITGSTRGIGYGLAAAFLKRSCAVMVSGRSQQAVDQAVAALADKSGGQVAGVPCDVTNFEQVQALWNATLARFGQVDIWINNAGIAHPQDKFWEQPPERIRTVVRTNILGTLYGSSVAIRGMLAQGFGALYNLEGLGSDGRRVEGLTLYGTTKFGLHYFNRALVAETRGMPLIVGMIRPGMVVTDMLTDQYEGRPQDWERAKKIFNILAEPVESVAEWAAEKVLANRKTGLCLRRYSTFSVLMRFALAPFRKRNLFVEEQK